MYGYESSCPEGVDQNTALLATAAAIGNTGKYFIENIYLNIPPACSCGCGGDLPRGDAAAGGAAAEAGGGAAAGAGRGELGQAAGPRHARWVQQPRRYLDIVR